MDSLNAMEVFVRVVQAGSFSEAARNLNLTPSAVSKQVSRLEDRLGARLINRTTRRLGLTEEGSAFYERAQRILADVEEAEQAVSHLHGAPARHLEAECAGGLRPCAYSTPAARLSGAVPRDAGRSLHQRPLCRLAGGRPRSGDPHRRAQRFQPDRPQAGGHPPLRRRQRELPQASTAFRTRPRTWPHQTVWCSSTARLATSGNSTGPRGPNRSR